MSTSDFDYSSESNPKSVEIKENTSMYIILWDW